MALRRGRRKKEAEVVVEAAPPEVESTVVDG